MTKYLIVALMLAGCSSSPSPAPNPSKAIDTECERAYACVVEADAGLPVSAAFCESEATARIADAGDSCDQKAFDDCASANSAADCDTARANATKPGGSCSSCFGL